MKTSELTGAALDWAVAQCLGLEVAFDSWGVCYIGKVQRDECGLGYPAPFEPSDNWAQGGPIIEREEIDIIKVGIKQWRACIQGENPVSHYGPTPLIAAMRCYVANKLGDSVEVLEGLTP